jgi:putative transposase
MPRVARIAPGGYVYHVLNRAHGRKKLFHKPADYRAFLKTLARAKQIVPVEVLGFCLMPDHWHLVVRTRREGDLSRFMLRVMTAHVRRHAARLRNQPDRQLYQGRFKNFPVAKDRHLPLLLRYIESNAQRAKLVRAPQAWPWSSLRQRLNGDPLDLLDAWPVDRPRNWTALVARPLSEQVVQMLQTCIRRGRPLGSPEWVKRTVKRLGLEFTVRPQGRPRKKK